MKISVVLRTYNRNNLLKEALSSISNQSYSNWEVLIFDDMGSIDNFETYSKFKSYHPNNRVLYITAATPYEFFKKSWTNSLGLMGGDVCVRLDDDDLLLPHTLEYINNLYSNNVDLEFTYGSSKSFDSDKNILDGIITKTPFESGTTSEWGPYTIPNNSPWKTPYRWIPNYYDVETRFTSIIHASRFNVLCVYHLYTFKVQSVLDIISKIDISSNLCDDLEFYSQLDYMGLHHTAIKDILILCRTHTDNRITDLSNKADSGLDWRGEVERVRCKVDMIRENGFVSKIVLIDIPNIIMDVTDSGLINWIENIQYDCKKY